MPVASRVMQYLNRQGLAYQQLHHDRVGTLEAAIEVAKVVQDEVAVAEILVDAKGVVMSITPLGKKMDLERLNKMTHRNLQRIAQHQADRLFKDCEPGSHPPVAKAYGVHAICDETLFSREQIYIQSGSHTTLLRLTKDCFQQMMGNALKMSVCVCEQVADAAAGNDNSLQEVDIKERLNRLYRLPPMPTVAARILQITQDIDASVDDLAKVIEQDPSLTAQVLRQAASALYGYRGEIKTIKDAVARVLGFERVSQIALSIAASKAFDLPKDGPLGLRNFWKHAMHCSLLVQRLAFHVPDKRVDPGVAYLAGLLHNFGLLLLGHLFKPEFGMLNKLAASEPYTELSSLEKQVLGMGSAKELVGVGHGQLGAILLEKWQLPEEITATAAHHQEKDYEGEHQDYVALIQLANCLLKELELGDDLMPDDPIVYTRRLGIDADIAFEVFEQLKQSSATLTDLAAGM
ncbi:HDOD domain-containing protein [Hahella ganghwensis]|uniref:HDOD domain-containing protein n=1 Tax=Hahella ganghwensis TaxID=286420 RepID=UPI0003A67AEA|nr:HDOD domain-containing protein [Hahella ganghwensis]